MNGRASRLVPYLLAFFSSLCIMILELVASRLVARHVGASLSVWTSVIGIMLGGICLGNVLGGRLADKIDPSRALGPLYALGAALTLGILAMNGAISYVPGRSFLPLSLDTILVVTLDFLVPGTVLGMIGPIVAKMAVDQSRQSGGAIGDVYFMGAIGSIAGTFLAGFVLMYLAPTSTIVILVAAGLLFVGLVLVRDGELSGDIVTASILAVALLIGFVGLIGIAFTLVAPETSETSRAFLDSSILIFYGALAVLGVAFVCAFIGAIIARDFRAVIAVAAVALLALGSVETMGGSIRGPGIMLGSTKINILALGGGLITFGLAVDAFFRLKRAMSSAQALDDASVLSNPQHQEPAIDLRDLSALAFISSLAFMTLEMVAGRLVTRSLGSSIYGWTSVIGVLLGGLSVGNWLGGRIANRVTSQSRAATLFLVASILTVWVIIAETPHDWMVRNPIEYFLQKKPGKPLFGHNGSVLGQVNSMAGVAWPIRILFWVSVEFFLPAVAMGTVSPVVAKLAVERVRSRTKGTGAAIGQVYAWGMVGSILGTFLAGFALIDIFGTKGLILVLATVLAVAATILGQVRHAVWAGIPLGLCVITFLPNIVPAKTGMKRLDGARVKLVELGRTLGLREDQYDTETDKFGIAYLDESNYYFIKISNEPQNDGGQKRTLVLDNLIHGYFIKNEPERLDYDYEHVYALVAHRVMQQKAKTQKIEEVKDVPLSTLFLGGGSYTFPRYLQKIYPKTISDVAEIDPAVTEANHRALWLPRDDKTIRTTWGDARQFVDRSKTGTKYDLIFGDAFNDFSVPWHLTTKEFNERVHGMLSDEGVYMINIIDVYLADRKAAFDSLYHGEEAHVAKALSDLGILNAQELSKKILLALDDKKLGVSTTEFARKATDAVKPIHKIVSTDTFEKLMIAEFEKAKIPMRGTREELLKSVEEILNADENAKALPSRIPAWTKAVVDADFAYNSDFKLPARAAASGVYEAREFGSFLGSWVETAKKSFGEYVYVFGTASRPGNGQRETFVVVASRKPLDLAQLGSRDTDRHFYDPQNQLVEPEKYNDEHLSAVKLRSRGIILTDDYAPVENLLAPVARTRANDD